MDSKALFHLTYGLYVLSTRLGERDHGCIINTAVQIANDPVRIAVSVINQNLTCDVLKHTGEFNISALTTETPFSIFQQLGMRSGRDGDKFADLSDLARSQNGMVYLPKCSNAYLSCKIVSQTDLGSHTLFVAEVTDGEVLSEVPSCTYAYYQSDIKPKPKPVQKPVWVCQVCGYVYEGEELPDDFVCPLCYHGKEDFVLVEPGAQAPQLPEAPRYICPVCGYIHEGPMEEDFICPICRVPGNKFQPLYD